MTAAGDYEGLGAARVIGSGPREEAHVFTCEQWVASGPEETFCFFSNVAHLEAITPPFLNFAILTPLPIEMRPGALIEYRLRLFGMPVGWLTRIEEWTPLRSFTDIQVRGPYARWVHRHRFAPRDGGTQVSDHVEYRMPWSAVSGPVHALFVRPALERIFAYRRDVIARLLT